MQGCDNLRWVFILDTEALLRNRADMQADKFGGAFAKHELTTRLLGLNSSQRFVICYQVQKLFQIINFSPCRDGLKIERGERGSQHGRRKRETFLERGSSLLEPAGVDL